MSYNIMLPQLLVASPLLDDPEFSRTMVLITNHDSKKGSVGFVISRQMALLPDYNEALLNGGPVSLGEYFVSIHSRDFQHETSNDVGGRLFVSSMADVLSEISVSGKPQKRAHFTGYAGFAPGELEETMKEGTWVPIQFDEKYLFEVLPSNRWETGIVETGIIRSKSEISNIVHVDFGGKEVS
jgi:putative transcriptional regulator